MGTTDDTPDLPLPGDPTAKAVLTLFIEVMTLDDDGQVDATRVAAMDALLADQDPRDVIDAMGAVTAGIVAVLAELLDLTPRDLWARYCAEAPL